MPEARYFRDDGLADRDDRLLSELCVPHNLRVSRSTPVKQLHKFIETIFGSDADASGCE